MGRIFDLGVIKESSKTMSSAASSGPIPQILRRLCFATGLIHCGDICAGQGQVTFPYRVQGVCPFECCHYGDWTAVDPIPVYEEEQSTEAAMFTIQSGQHFVAEQGAYWSITPLVMRAKISVELPVANDLVPLSSNRAKMVDPSGPPRMVKVSAGEKIYVLANLGEGAARGIADEEPVALDSSMYAPMGSAREKSPYVVIEPKQIPCERVTAPDNCPKTAYYTPNKTEWWVRVRTGQGSGWIKASGAHIRGADMCE